MSYNFNIFKLDDNELVSKLKQIVEELQVTDQERLNFQFQIAPSTLPINCKYSELDTTEALQEILKVDAVMLSQSHILFEFWNMSIKVERGHGFDTAHFNYPGDQNSNNRDLIAKVLISLQKHLRPITHKETVANILGPELAEFYRQRERGLLRLEDLSLKLIKENTQYREELDKETNTLKHQGQRELEEQKRALQEAYAAKEEELKAHKSELEEKVKQLDDRASRHARRQIRQDLKKILEARGKDFSLSENTSKKRWPIHILFWILIVTFSILFGRAISGAAEPAATYTWYLLLRIPISAAALAASVLYYIRWNDQWSRQHADEEFRLKRLELDIDRASWVVEMALEWKDEEGSEIPQILVDRLTKNLFLEGYSEGATHPSEDLASALLGASSNLNLKLPSGGTELSIDRKGIKEFKKATESN